jgi:thymidine phosphorylase
MLNHAYTSGEAWQKFRQMVAHQGGDLAALDDLERLPQSPAVVPLPAPHAGFIASIDAQKLGLTLNDLGGGRIQKGAPIDPAVGLVLARKVGDQVAVGDTLLHIHAASTADAERVAPNVQAAYAFKPEPVEPPPLIAEIVTGEETHQG